MGKRRRATASAVAARAKPKEEARQRWVRRLFGRVGRQETGDRRRCRADEDRVENDAEKELVSVVIPRHLAGTRVQAEKVGKAS